MSVIECVSVILLVSYFTILIIAFLKTMFEDLTLKKLWYKMVSPVKAGDKLYFFHLSSLTIHIFEVTGIKKKYKNIKIKGNLILGDTEYALDSCDYYCNFNKLHSSIAFVNKNPGIIKSSIFNLPPVSYRRVIYTKNEKLFFDFITPYIDGTKQFPKTALDELDLYIPPKCLHYIQQEIDKANKKWRKLKK